ncbi:hypothetical protein BH11BAC5_BH11BAC5_45940 [soil metagenome]|jgi:hypothetical protein
MEKKLQNNIGYLFIGIWLCALIGFHKTYTINFPAFTGFHWQQHFHGIMLMSWFLMLIIQPFLIKYNKPAVHRKLGQLGYVLAPLVCYSIFLVTKMIYYRETITRPEESVLAQLSLDIPTIFIFGLFFTLAMVNRKTPAVHMRYMIATSLLMIGPGLGRALIIWGGIPFPVSVSIVYYISEIIAVLFLLNDVRRGNNFKPFLTITIVLILNHICWAFQHAAWWQSTAKWFVTHAF